MKKKVWYDWLQEKIEQIWTEQSLGWKAESFKNVNRLRLSELFANNKNNFVSTLKN